MGMDSKSDRASIADISLPVHAVQATSSYAESLPRPLNGSRAQQSFSSLQEWLGIPGGIGDFQIDNGRELYVPVSILHGKLLYRDICYMYGPLAPYQPSLHGNDL